jgi:predicted permease
MNLVQIVYDLKYALRRFASTPAFTCTVLAVTALGLAANIAVFSIVNAMLLKPLPFPDPDRVVVLGTKRTDGTGIGASPAMYAHWRKQSSVVTEVTAFQSAPVTLSGGAIQEQVRAGRVSASYFRVFGAEAPRGRTFTEEEDRPGGARVVVLSHGLWMRLFGGNDVIGQPLSINGEPHTIVGVLGSDFEVTDFGPPPELWVPFQLDPLSKTHGQFFGVVARLTPGVTLEQARDRLQVSTEEFRREHPNTMGGQSVFTADRVGDALVANARPILFVVLGTVSFVLLIACSNVASLFLLQATGRAQEIAVRAAIGAGRGRIVRQLLTESLLLSIGGGVIGLALGNLAFRLFLTAGLPRLPRLTDASAATLDWRVVAFALGLSILTGVLFGLAPAIQVSRASLSSATKSADGRSSSGPRRRRTQAMLVVAQVSLTVVLLVGAVLFIRTVAALTRVDAGFDPHDVLTMRTSLSGPQFRTATQVAALVQRGSEALRAVPGAAVVGAACGLPLEGGYGLPFVIPGRPLPAGQFRHGGAAWLAVSSGYFEALRTPVLRGRTFTDRDMLQSPPVAIIDEIMARQYWPDRDPLGQRVVLGHGVGPQFQDEPEREIVGVVGSVRGNRLSDAPGAQVYVPQGQLPDAANLFIARGAPMAWIVRTNARPEALARSLQTALEQATGLPVSNVRTMDEIVRRSITRERFGMWLTTVFSAIALVLAAIGIYGLISYSVEQRTVEIGIRLALGAEAAKVKRMIMWQGLRLALVGLAAGLFVALGVTRLIARILFGVRAWDPATFAIVAIVVLIVALLAAWLPARRASRIAPIVALRYQ